MLKAHGVETLFGLCGDTSPPFYDALARLPHGMRHILTRDERPPPTWRIGRCAGLAK
jgi:acetolactate synthase-1/2/3 large subunit